MRRVVSLWLPRFATDRWALQQSQRGRSKRPWQSSGNTTETTSGGAAPLALIRAEQGRLVLAAVNAAAAESGLAPGLPLADARAILPDLKTAEEAPADDARALARLAEWCSRYTPWVAIDPASSGGEGGLLLDVTGCTHLFGGEAALLTDLLARLRCFGYEARAALAETPGAAWALARFAADKQPIVLPKGELHTALAPLPPAALRLPAERCELLARLGLTRIGDLYEIPAAALAPRFGEGLARRLDQALGKTSEPISPLAEVPPFLARRVLAEPIMTAEAIAAGLTRLLAGLCAQLEDAQAGARRLALYLYRVDGSVQQLALGTSRPSREPAHLMRLFSGHLERIDPGFGIDALALAAPESEPLSALQLALGPGNGSIKQGAGSLAELIDRLNGRLGPGSVTVPAAYESHLPERAVRPADPFEGRDASSLQDDSPWQPWRALESTRPTRPLRLLPWPEPVEAIALLPDHPPAQFRWRRVRHKVAARRGPGTHHPGVVARAGPAPRSGTDSGVTDSATGDRCRLRRHPARLLPGRGRRRPPLLALPQRPTTGSCTASSREGGLAICKRILCQRIVPQQWRA